MKPTPYGPFPYSAINRRPKWALPDGARVALWVIPNIEFFPLDRAMPGDSNERPKGNGGTPMVRQRKTVCPGHNGPGYYWAN